MFLHRIGTGGYTSDYICVKFLFLFRSLYTPTYSFWVLSSVLISQLWLLPGLIPFASHWHSGWTFKKKTYTWTWTTVIQLQYVKVILPECTHFWWQNIFFPIFAYRFSIVIIKIVNNTRNAYIWLKFFSYIVAG